MFLILPPGGKRIMQDQVSGRIGPRAAAAPPPQGSLEPSWLEPKWLEPKWLEPKWLRMYVCIYIYIERER